MAFPKRDRRLASAVVLVCVLLTGVAVTALVASLPAGRADVSWRPGDPARLPIPGQPPGAPGSSATASVRTRIAVPFASAASPRSRIRTAAVATARPVPIVPAPLDSFPAYERVAVAAAPTGSMVIDEGYAETANTSVVINSNVSGATLMRIVPSQWTTVSVGWARAAAIRADGSLFAWGVYPVGDGRAFSSPYPVAVMPGEKFVDVACGQNFTIALRADGTAWAWAQTNSNGELGNGSTVASNLPVRAGGNRLFKKISAGDGHVLAIDTAGNGWAWGDNSGWGEIGDGTTADRTSPVGIGIVGTFADVIASGQSSFAIMSNGDVWAWGDNRNGILGVRDTANHFSPVKLAEKWTKIRAGTWHSLAIKSDGSLWGWGTNSSGALASLTTSLTPQMIDSGASGRWEDALAGDAVSVVRRADGTVSTFGSVGYFNAGGSNITTFMPSASVPATATKVAGTDSTFMALTNSGDLVAFGMGAHGQLGNNTNVDSRDATVSALFPYAATSTFDLPSGDGLKSLTVEYRNAAGEVLTLADSITLRTDSPPSIVLANGAVGTVNATVPVTLSSIGAKTMRIAPRVTSVQAGDRFNALLTEDGRLLGGGMSTYWLMGDGTQIQKPWFRAMAPGRSWQAMSVGQTHVLAIAADGSLWAWGFNAYGQIGRGDWSTYQSTPYCVDSTKRWKAVAAGQNHSLAIAEDGSLYAWGWNMYGQVKAPAFNGAFNTPQFIAAGPFKSIAAGWVSSAAITSGGTLYTWGEATNGQLGNGGTVVSSMQVIAGSWSTIAMGYRHTLAIKSDGSLWGWGKNASGSVGNGSLVQANSPVMVDPSEWTAVTAGYDTSAGIRKSGSLCTWGSATYYNVQSYTTPRALFNADGTPDTGFAAVDLGWRSTIAIKKDGSVWTWGEGQNGELGLDTSLYGPILPALQTISSPGEVVVGLTAKQAYSTSTSTVLPAGSGPVTVSVSFTDPAGNVTWASDSIVRDTPPTTTFVGSTSWRSADATFSLVATDPAAAIVGTFYRIEDGPVVPYPGGSILVTEPGPTAVSFWSVDASGQVEATKTAYVRIDRIATVAMDKSAGCEDCHLDQNTDHPRRPCGLCHNNASSWGAGDESPVPVHGSGTTGLTWDHCGCGSHPAVTWVIPGDQGDHYMNVLTTFGCDNCHAGQYSAISTKHPIDEDVAHEADDAAMDDCGICHARVLTREHERWNGGVRTCTTCHGATARVEASTAVAAKRTDCAACHGIIDHAGYHASAGFDVAGCGSCHDGNLVPEHGGRGLKCRTCHASTTPAVVAAIAANKTGCGECHVAGHPHDPAALDGVMAEGVRACTDCHSKDLVVEHSKATSSSKAGGCGVCHPVSPPAQIAGATWDGTCEQGGCHAPGSSRAVHSSHCLGCHDSVQPSFATVKVDFVAAQKVDRASACLNCHWEPAGSHPYHYVDWNCGSCHPSWGAIDPARVAKVFVPGRGYFASTASANADTDTLHAIHAAPRWPSDVVKNGRQCGSCHAAADCTACHTGSIDPSHQDHTYDATLGAYWPGTAPAAKSFGAGTTAGNERERRLSTSLTCSNATCHDISSGALVAQVADDNVAGVAFSAAPGWSRSSQTGYLGNTVHLSATSGARVDYTFTGRKVQFVSDTAPYRGKARVSIDGFEAAIVDLYGPVTKQVVAYSSGTLTPGSHTITVEVLHERGASSTGYSVAVDAFRTFPQWGTTLTPCATCHEPDAFTGSSVDRTKTHY